MFEKSVTDTKKKSIFIADRHWKYHSIDPKTGLNEFCTGPASDEHVSRPPKDPEKRKCYQYVKTIGGFLLVNIKTADHQSCIVFKHYGTDGKEKYRFRKTIYFDL